MKRGYDVRGRRHRKGSEGIVEYIAVDSPSRAYEVLKKVKRKASSLHTLPDRGRIVPELQDQGITQYRELIVQECWCKRKLFSRFLAIVICFCTNAPLHFLILRAVWRYILFSELLASSFLCFLLLLRCIKLFDTLYFNRLVLAKPFEIEGFNEIWQRRFPGLLLMICDLSKFLWIHTQFSCHLDVGMRKMILFSDIYPCP